MKTKLWNRKLSCGHNRMTNIAYICGKSDKPKVGDECYCRECCGITKIIGVNLVNDEESLKDLDELKEKIGK